jgi:hypothetical protein
LPSGLRRSANREDSAKKDSIAGKEESCAESEAMENEAYPAMMRNRGMYVMLPRMIFLISAK